MIRIRNKPLSVNSVWQGRRFKTPAYKTYEKELMLLLPDLEIPDGNLAIPITFGLSSKLSDIDNPVKPFMDILQKRYGFDDRRVYKMILEKKIVKKGEEYIEFEILPIELCELF